MKKRKILFAVLICSVLITGMLAGFLTPPAYALSITVSELGLEVPIDGAAEYEEENGFYYLYALPDNPGVPYVMFGRLDGITIDQFYPSFTAMMEDTYEDLQVVQTPLHTTVGSLDLIVFQYVYPQSDSLIYDIRAGFEHNGAVYMFCAKEKPDEGYTVGTLLQDVLAGLKFTDEPVEQPQTQPQTQPQPQNPPGTGRQSTRLLDAAAGKDTAPVSFRITALTDQDSGLPMARCYAPSDYGVNCAVQVGIVGITSPMQIICQAVRPDQKVMFMYLSERNYADDSEWINGTEVKQEEGSWSLEHLAEVRTSMDAYEYCDFLRDTIMVEGISYTLMEDGQYSQEMQNTLQNMAETFFHGMADNGVPVDNVKFSFAEKVYRLRLKDVFTLEDGNNGEDYYMYIGSLVRYYDFFNGAGFGGLTLGTTRRTWGPLQSFVALIPASEWNQVYPQLKEFMNNTSVSDEFCMMLEHLSLELTLAKARLSSELIDQIIAESEQEYLQNSNYDTTENFSDYIFDQNDYETSSGEHVKMSTQYDHVYEDEYGNIWGSNSGGQAGWTELEKTTLGN